MGNSLSLCLSDSSAKIVEESQEEPALLSTRYQILGENFPTIDTSAEDLNGSPRSVDSSQSVLSVISPTKDRVLCGRSIFQSPMPVHQVHHHLRLASGQHCIPGAQSSISNTAYDLISKGSIAALEEFVQAHQLDLTSLRLQKLAYTPLHVAVLHNQLLMVQYLLNKNVDIDTKDLDGQSAVYLAYTLGHYAIAEALVAHKAASFCASPYSPYANSSVTGGRSRSSSTSVHSECSRDGTPAVTRERVFSIGAEEDGVNEIVVPRFSSFRSVNSIASSIQRDSAKYNTSSKSHRQSDSVSFAVPSPHTTDSGSSAVAHSQTVAVPEGRPTRPLSKRIKKAAGKVMHLVNPKKTTSGGRNSEVFRPSLI